MQPKNDPYERLRKQLKALLDKKIGKGKKYTTLEKFCWNYDIQKSSLSRFLSGAHKDYKFSNLVKIAKACGKKLVIKIE